MKIFCQYSCWKTLPLCKGDYITEAGFYTALSQFADVQYGKFMFDPNRSDFGLSEYPGAIEAHVPKDCDVYYVRANPAVVRQIPEGKPIVYVAAPFDSYSYQRATVLATFTDAWARDLRRGRKLLMSNPNGLKFNNTLTIYQTIMDSIRPQQGSRMSSRLREQVGGDFIIGCFGRIVPENYPHVFVEVLPWLVDTFPGVRFLVSTTVGGLQRGLPNTTYHTRFTFEQMPYAISACDLVLAHGKGYTWSICGCIRALEAAACGVPVLLCKEDAKVEHLGDDYELFLPTHDPDKIRPRDVRVMKDKLKLIIKDAKLRKRLSRELPIKTSRYTVKKSSRRLRVIFKECVKW